METALLNETLVKTRKEMGAVDEERESKRKLFEIQETFWLKKCEAAEQEKQYWARKNKGIAEIYV